MTEPLRKSRPSGLGRGLSALLGDNVPEAPITGGDSEATSAGVRMLPVMPAPFSVSVAAATPST